jgi:hypothetical protein
MLMPAALPSPVSPAVLKIPLLALVSTLAKIVPSPSAEIVPEALIVIAPAFPEPKVVVSTEAPRVRDRLVVVRSIPPESPIADSSTSLKMPLTNPILVSPSAEIVPEALIVIAPAFPEPKVLTFTALPVPETDWQ